ncbi:phospholipase D-like domain-containing protein [Leisingera sp. ANG59]|uniref:phospholipase D-like domain-containing protein n=1 Tax=Leisingera sp. ANG59 TaxID=2675221 RepID=UPI0015726F90|nr:phospholipase D-like domain-containing protein [Leisingera sp. ANG59]NSY40125.1 hypothetical protein [Leisingera sp. ANG59]
MSDKFSASPKTTARLVVTMPPEPSHLADALAANIASDYIALTRTTDAFQHLASIASERLTVLIPYIDRVGAAWATELFEKTKAKEKILILRDASQLRSCGAEQTRVEESATQILDYGGDDLSSETFHAKIVLADGVAAYVGSANLLRRSKSTNLECGMLVEGPAVGAVKVLVDAVTSISNDLNQIGKP